MTVNYNLSLQIVVNLAFFITSWQMIYLVLEFFWIFSLKLITKF